MISRRLTVTPNGLALRSLFLKRSMLFTDVESLDVKFHRGDEGPDFERAKILASDGQSITLDSTMPGYRPALEPLRSHAAAKACLDRLADPDFA